MAKQMLKCTNIGHSSQQVINYSVTAYIYIYIYIYIYMRCFAETCNYLLSKSRGCFAHIKASKCLLLRRPNHTYTHTNAHVSTFHCSVQLMFHIIQITFKLAHSSRILLRKQGVHMLLQLVLRCVSDSHGGSYWLTSTSVCQ